MLRLLCDTNQMAFGSSSALLAILKYLPSVNTAFSYGIIDEVLSKSGLVHCKLKINNKISEEVKSNIDLRKYDAVLVVSNLTNVNWYLDFKIPVFYVDIHSWWHPNFQHRIKEEASLYFTENFLETNQCKEKHFISVGPIITFKSKLEVKPKLKQILINLGGGQNRWIEPGVNSNYASIIVGVLKEIESSIIGYDVYIAGGTLLIAQIRNKLPQNKFTINSFSQNDYLDILEESEILITSPGLNAIFEGLYYGNKIVMLPPQNASQIIQLKYYEDFGLVDKGINLDKFYSFPTLEQMRYLEEEDLTNQTLEALKFLESSPFAQKQIYNHITNQLNKIFSQKYRSKIDLAKQILGPPGAESIAKHITLYSCNSIDTTVVIPTTASRSVLLNFAINQILQNTKLPKEILIIVDNNEEGFERVKAQYEFSNFIKVVHNIKRKGVSATRNYCVNFISTSFISFLDDDDYWESDYLENVFSGNSFDVALVGFKKKKSDGITLEKLPPLEIKENLFLVKNPGVRGSNITISKQLFLEIKGFNEELLSFNDMDFGIRLSKQPHIEYKSIQKHLVVFNSHNGTRISTPLSKENKQGISKFLELHKGKMSEQELLDFRKRTVNIWGFDPIKK